MKLTRWGINIENFGGVDCILATNAPKGEWIRAEDVRRFILEARYIAEESRYMEYKQAEDLCRRTRVFLEETEGVFE